MTLSLRKPGGSRAPGKEKGAMGYVLAWLLGVPLPILIIVALLRGCT